MAPRTKPDTRSTARPRAKATAKSKAETTPKATAKATATAKKSTTRRVSLFSAFSQRPVVRWSLRALTGTLAVAFAFSLVVYPVRDYFAQRSRIADKQQEFEALADANEQLYNEVQRLKTPEGVRSAARSQLGYVMPGEERVALTPLPTLPTALPDAWPYTLVTNILRVKAAQAGTTPGALAPLAP